MADVPVSSRHDRPPVEAASSWGSLSVLSQKRPKTLRPFSMSCPVQPTGLSPGRCSSATAGTPASAGDALPFRCFASGSLLWKRQRCCPPGNIEKINESDEDLCTRSDRCLTAGDLPEPAVAPRSQVRQLMGPQPAISPRMSLPHTFDIGVCLQRCATGDLPRATRQAKGSPRVGQPYVHHMTTTLVERVAHFKSACVLTSAAKSTPLGNTL